MVSKAARQRSIDQILRKQQVRSQEELSGHLHSLEIRVTQATLSRDIREMGLIKVRGVYHAPSEWLPAVSEESIRRSFSQLVTQSGISGNIAMIKTGPGNAHPVAVLLDGAQWPEVLGTVAGDDTVFILLKSANLGRRILKRIEEYRI